MRTAVEFIAFIQRLLVEGDFTATYKYALLHAIADACVESPHVSANSQLSISFEVLSDKFLRLYWNQARPFGVSCNGNQLQQNSNGHKQAAILSIISESQAAGLFNINQLYQHPKLHKKARCVAMNTLKTGPLWRLQKLARKEECFLYPHDNTKQYIQLNPGIAGYFREFYDLIVYLARAAWTDKIISFKHNQGLVGAQAHLPEFLFGQDRKALYYARPILVELQKNRCFYCNKTLDKQAEVDHFIPFAKYAFDLGHNFVLADRVCNNSKRDFLAGYEHKHKWEDQNMVTYVDDLTAALSSYVECTPEKSRSITDWAYTIAQNSNASLWEKKRVFVPA